MSPPGRGRRPPDPSLAPRFGAALAAAGVETVRLHVGLAKTGTTYLQALMLGGETVLRERGALFPRSLLRHTGHGGAARGARSAGHGALLQILRGSGQGAEALGLFEAEVAAARPRCLILSAEGLTHPDGLALATPLAAALTRQAVTVLTYVRNPADWVESLYKELATGGHYREARRLEGTLLSEIETAADLRPIIDAWAFPGARFELASYEAARRDLAANFAARVPEAAGLSPPAPANRSPGRTATERFRDFNARTRRLSRDDFRRAFADFTAQELTRPDDDRDTLLPPEARATLVARWMERNRFVVSAGLMDAETFAGLGREQPRASPWAPLAAPRVGLLHRLGILRR